MNSDNFSWRRVGLVARYHYPNLKIQILIYPLIAIAIATVNYFLLRSEVGVFLTPLSSLVLTVALCFGPLILARRSNRIVETMLPATWVEKSVFIVGYCLIFIPIAIAGVNWCVIRLLECLLGMPEFSEEVLTAMEHMNLSRGYLLTQIPQDLVAPATCMFAVMALRRNRMVAIAWTFAPLVALIVIGAFFGFSLAFSEGFRDAMLENVAGPGRPNDAEVAEAVSYVIRRMVVVLGIICALYDAVMVWLTFRKIKNVQI